MSGAVMHAEAWHLRLHKFDPVGTSTPQTGTSAEHWLKNAAQRLLLGRRLPVPVADHDGHAPVHRRSYQGHGALLCGAQNV